MDILQVLKELSFFSRDILTLEAPVNEGAISEFEKKFIVSLPDDYKIFLHEYNGVDLMGTEVLGIGKGNNSLEYVFVFEHNLVEKKMFDYLIPFSPDGFGNHYCFDSQTNNNKSCDIVFWQHDLSYNDLHRPESTHTSFTDWFKEVIIDWTLENYDYNGFER